MSENFEQSKDLFKNLHIISNQYFWSLFDLGINIYDEDELPYTIDQLVSHPLFGEKKWDENLLLEDERNI